MNIYRIIQRDVFIVDGFMNSSWWFLYYIYTHLIYSDFMMRFFNKKYYRINHAKYYKLYRR